MTPDPVRQLFASSTGNAPSRQRLAGRHILVVGAGQRATEDQDTIGTGRAMSLLFAREGATVSCADRELELAQCTVDLIAAQGGRALAIRADISDERDVCTMFATAEERFGPVNGVIANVGISFRTSLVDETVEGWDRVLAVNLRGHMLVAQRALRACEDGSSIVLISSSASISPRGRNPAYESSKAALSALCRSAALEGQRRGIRANVLAPGLLDTPMGRSASQANPGRVDRALPFGRQGTGWELAYAALFLVSTEASYVNAQTLFVDGGLSGHVV